MARAVLLALGIEEAADDGLMAEAAGGFSGLPSRCHSLGRVDGVEFIDDSLSTNVLPAEVALEAYGDGRWPSWWVAMTGGSTTRRSAIPSPVASGRP